MEKEIDQELKIALISFVNGGKLQERDASRLDKDEKLQSFVEEIFAKKFAPIQRLVASLKKNF